MNTLHSSRYQVKCCFEQNVSLIYHGSHPIVRCFVCFVFGPCTLTGSKTEHTKHLTQVDWNPGTYSLWIGGGGRHQSPHGCGRGTRHGKQIITHSSKVCTVQFVCKTVQFRSAQIFLENWDKLLRELWAKR